jgi:hypothetical protein
MAVPKRRRLVWVVGLTVLAVAAGMGTVVAFPPAPPQGPILAESTVLFQEQPLLSWADDGLREPDMVTGGMTAAGLVKAGNEAIYGWNNGAHAVFSGDFNADGKWDIGVTGTAEQQGERCWYIRYGQGGGKFAGETKYCWGNGVTNVFSGDFNGDGKWDIGVTGTAAQKDRYWYIRYGDGKGGFGNETSYWWGNGVTNVFTGDFNGDGKWDIGVTGTAAESDRRWYIRYGDGKGGFSNETVFNWNNGVTNAFTGDFNGDGKWDIGVTGTSAQKERNWYIRYGDGKGQFPNEDVYAWNNGVTNVFTGDFNGDKMWDLGVTGDRIQKGGYWYIRFNQMTRQSPAPTPPSAPVNDPVLTKARNLTNQAYKYLLERTPSEDEIQYWANRIKSGQLTYEQVWTNIARSQERLNKFGYYAPSYGDYNGKYERCFGAVGNKCDGVWLATPDVQWVNTFDRADGVKMGYVRIAVAVGSILHDNICLDQPYGSWCSGLPTAVVGEIPLMRVLGPASLEWNKAVYNTRDGRYWVAKFGPYPTDKALQEKWSDDLTQVTARSSKMAKILPIGAMPVVSELYLGKETRQTKVLKAPAGTYVDREDQQFCASGSYTEEDRWWTAQWWGKCN